MPASTPLTIEEIRQAAMPKATKQARDYWEAGSNEEQTKRDNISDFNNYRIRARALVDVSAIDTRPARQFLDHDWSVPIGFAPSAFHQMACDEGECATAGAAKAGNWPMTLSSYANRSFSDVKAAGGDSAVFFQLYVFADRSTTKALVERVEKAGYKGLVLTVDTPFAGRRYSDFRNQFKLPSHLKLGNFDSVQNGPIDVGVDPNSAARKAAMSGKKSVANYIDPSITWDETIPWLKSITNLQIWVKGVTTAEDAELALKAGVDGIWVSNHGGRQLDSAVSSIESLPEVVDVVKGRVPVHVDSGFRRGSDIFKALALGADFVWIGRPVLYGLQYDGQSGLELVQSIFTEDLRYAMGLAGCQKVSDIKRSSLVRVGPAMQKL